MDAQMTAALAAAKKANEELAALVAAQKAAEKAAGLAEAVAYLDQASEALAAAQKLIWDNVNYGEVMPGILVDVSARNQINRMREAISELASR